jgi:hypothetical protein
VVRSSGSGRFAGSSTSWIERTEEIIEGDEGKRQIGADFWGPVVWKESAQNEWTLVLRGHVLGSSSRARALWRRLLTMGGKGMTFSDPLWRSAGEREHTRVFLLNRPRMTVEGVGWAHAGPARHWLYVVFTVVPEGE